jgi:hypothetical protein
MQNTNQAFKDYSYSKYDKEDLTGSTFFLCRYLNCVFNESILKHTFFGSCDFNSCPFEQADVEGALFIACHYFENLSDKKPITRELLQKLGALNSDKAITNSEELISALIAKAIPEDRLPIYLKKLSVLNKRLEVLKLIPTSQLIPNLSDKAFIDAHATDESISQVNAILNLLKNYPASIEAFISTLPKQNEIPTLKNSVAKFIIDNRVMFFPALVQEPLPDAITHEYPVLDVDYQRIFVNDVKKYLATLKFDESTDAFKTFDKIKTSLNKKETAYNDIAKIVHEMHAKINKGFLSLYAQQMKPVEKRLTELLKEYMQNKSEVQAVKNTM